MKLSRTTAAVISAVATIGGLALSTPAGAAPVTSTGSYENAYTQSRSVVVGKINGVAGNRHQFVLKTLDGKITWGKMNSYYCPSGANITVTWASTHCVKRSAKSLRTFRQNDESASVGWISSTERSATQFGPVIARDSATSRDMLIGVNLTMYRTDGQTRLTGDVVGQPLQTTSRQAEFAMTS